MALSSEEKRLRRIQRAHEAFKALSPGSCYRNVAAAFQKLVRLANADERGRCECISCGSRSYFKDMDGGHYVSRKHKSVLLDPSNCWPQCRSCNKHLNGNVAEYRKRLIDKIGLAEVERLEQAKFAKPLPINRWALAEIKVDLQDEIKRHEERLGM